MVSSTDLNATERDSTMLSTVHSAKDTLATIINKVDMYILNSGRSTKKIF